MSTDLPIHVRRGVRDDLPLVFSSWLNSAIEFPRDRGMRRSVYFAGKHRQIERTIARSELLVAAYDHDPNVAVGWACVEGDTLHFVYVKRELRLGEEAIPLRDRGIAHMLLEGRALRRCSHRPPMRDLPVGWVFDPFTLEEP